MPSGKDELRVVVRDFRATGVNNRSYLVLAGDAAVVVDPQRDVETYLTAAEQAGARIAAILETHVHNDYVSGGRELARRSGADHVLPADSGAAFAHRAAPEGMRLDAGPLHIRALHTPGHTPEHVSYLIEEPAHAPLLFSGGSLLAGSAGRTDLLGPDWTRRLTEAQYGSIHRLAQLDSATRLLPTHGAGSFCTAAGTGAGLSTIGTERRTNPTLGAQGLAAFTDRHLRGLPNYPTYYADMAPINRAGSRPLGMVVAPSRLAPAEAAALLDAGIPAVDGRPRRDFAAAHLPGSINIDLDESFAAYVGWILPFDSPLFLVVDDVAQALEATRQLARIGFDLVRGVLLGLDDWRADGRPVRTYPVLSVDEARAALQGEARPLVLDVRQPAEWTGGTLADSTLRFVGDLGDPTTWLDRNRPILTVCEGGYRAAIAASILDGAGYRVTTVDGGGVPDLLRSV